MEITELVSLLRKNESFETVPEEALENLLASAETCQLPDSTNLIHQGRTGESIWLLLEGGLNVFVDGDLVNQVSTKGEVLGEISAVSQTAATATVTSKGEVLALCIPQAALHEAMKTSPELAASMLRSMAKYLGRR